MRAVSNGSPSIRAERFESPNTNISMSLKLERSQHTEFLAAMIHSLDGEMDSLASQLRAFLA